MLLSSTTNATSTISLLVKNFFKYQNSIYNGGMETSAEKKSGLEELREIIGVK